MTPELWERVKPLYEAAAILPEPGRAAFIARACNADAVLKAALESLFQSSSDPTGSVHAGALNLQQAFPGSKSFAPGDLILGRFRIVRLLGIGGMGEVYEADDLELGRIALKTIRTKITADPGHLTRFRREVQLARRVSSPYVCRIHEFFFADDPAAGSPRAFLTMECLDGITLADHIRQFGPMPWPQARTIALQLCRALAAIHEAGIIHRDVKTRNIMLVQRSGTTCAVLMDFGVAGELFLSDETAPTGVTQRNAIVGTPRYMAPEQAQGKPLGPPADIYAFGLVLHELVTGKLPSDPPRPGKPATSTSDKAPPPKADLPRPCEQLLRKCLAYDPERRFQSMAEVERAIESVSPLTRLRQKWPEVLVAFAALAILCAGLLLIPAVGERARGILFASAEKHIAVLPFQIIGNNPDTTALGDGLVDSLAGKLADLRVSNRALWVVPASEVRARKVHDAAEAMRQFGATLVVEGTFERNGQGSDLKLTLIDPRKTREIGYVDVANQDGDLASLQDEAVTRLGRLMNVSVKESPRQNAAPSVAPTAYQDYLTGLGYFQRYDKPGNLDRAVAALEASVQQDPHLASGFSGLAQAYAMKYRMDSDPQWLSKAQEDSQRAAALDDHDPSTYVAMARIHELTGHHDLAVQEFQRAIALDPIDAEAWLGMARAYEKEGQNAEAETAYVRAAAIRPDDWTGYNALGLFYWRIGRPADAIAQYRRALQLTPDNVGLYINMGIAYMDSSEPGMLEKAEQAFRQSIAMQPTFIAWSNLGFLYAQEHRFQQSVAASEKALQLNSQSYDIWANLAAANEWLGNDREAAAARTKAIDLLRQAIRVDPQDGNAQSTLAALLAKNGLRDQAMEDIRISLALSPTNQYVLSQVADAFELLGDRGNAIRYLSEALANGLPRDRLSEDPEIRGILSDPRFLQSVTSHPGPHH